LHGMRDLGDFLARNGSQASLDQVIEGLKNKDIRARTKNIIEHPVTPEQAEEAVQARINLALEYEDLFRRERLAAIVYPTVPILPPLIRPQGDDITDTVDLNGKQVNQFSISLRNTSAAGVIGVPAMSIPVGFSSSGLPIGLSISGLADGESKLLGLALSLEAVLGHMPPPIVRLNQVGAPYAITGTGSSIVGQAIPSSAQTATSGATDNVDYVLAFLKQSAYLNVCANLHVPNAERPGAFTAESPLHRYECDFRIDNCGPGVRARNLLGEECGRARLRWVLGQNGALWSASAIGNFTSDDLFVFDDAGRNQLRGSGAGRLVPALFSDGSLGVEAHGNIVEGTGVFAGVQGSYVLTGRQEHSRLNLHYTLRLMDPSGAYQTASPLFPLNGTKPADRCITSLAFLGEPDPDHPVELRPTGATVHELLRAVHTDFDRGSGSNSLRSTMSIGPIVARWRTEVIFNPTDPSAPGTADRPMPVRLENVRITFLHSGGGTLDASISDGRGFAMAFPGVSGPLFRMTGFGPISQGTGRFSQAKGSLSMLGAIDLAPAAFSNYYLLHLTDPLGCLRC